MTNEGRRSSKFGSQTSATKPSVDTFELSCNRCSYSNTVETIDEVWNQIDEHTREFSDRHFVEFFKTESLLAGRANE